MQNPSGSGGSGGVGDPPAATGGVFALPDAMVIPPTGTAGVTPVTSAVPQYSELWYSSGERLVYIQLNKADGLITQFVASPIMGLGRGYSGITMLRDGSLFGMRLVGNLKTQFYHVQNPPRDGSPVTPQLLGDMPDKILIEALYTDCANRLYAMDTGLDVGGPDGNRLLRFTGDYLKGDFSYQVVTDFSQVTADIDDLGPGIDDQGIITDNPGFAIDSGTVYRFNYQTAIGTILGQGGTWGVHALGGSLFDDGRARLYLLSSQAEVFEMNPKTFAVSAVLGIGPTAVNGDMPAHSGMTGPLTNCQTNLIIL
jgi:hypothetical protein